MEHLSPDSKVMMALVIEAIATRKLDLSGTACAAAVGHDCGSEVGQVWAMGVGQDGVSAVGQGVAWGVAHPANVNTTTKIKVKLRTIYCLLFILSSSFRILNRL